MKKSCRNPFFPFWMPHPSSNYHTSGVKEIWVSQAGEITYLSSQNEQTLVEKVSLVNSYPVLTYAYTQSASAPRSPFKALLEADYCLWADDLGWDLETGLAAAYLLGDASMTHFGKPVSSDWEEVNVMDAEIIHKPKIQQRFRQLAVGLKNWWQHTAQKTRHWTQQVSDRLKDAIR